MIVLLNGARIIDTPGMRELGMCDMDQELMILFLISQSLKPAVNSVTADMKQNRDVRSGLRLRMEYYRGIDTNCIGLCMKKADMQQR